MVLLNFQSDSISGQPVMTWSSNGGFNWHVGAKVVFANSTVEIITDAKKNPAKLPLGKPPMCTAGSVYDNDEGLCSPCPLGTYAAASENMAACLPCPMGSYQPEAGKVQC